MGVLAEAPVDVATIVPEACLLFRCAVGTYYCLVLYSLLLVMLTPWRRARPVHFACPWQFWVEARWLVSSFGVLHHG